MPDIKEAGATLIAISPQLEQYSSETIKQHKLSYDLLTDQGNRVARQFGLVFKFPDDLRQLYTKFGIDLEEFNGDDSWTLPIPGRFVIDRDSTIIAADANPDYTVRPEPDQTLEALRAMNER